MAWGQSPIAWLWLGVRQHCSAEPGLMWQPCTRVSSMSVAAPMLVLVSRSGTVAKAPLLHCLGLQSDTQGLFPSLNKPMNPVPITCVLNGTPAPGKDPGSCPSRAGPDSVAP